MASLPVFSADRGSGARDYTYRWDASLLDYSLSLSPCIGWAVQLCCPRSKYWEFKNIIYLYRASVCCPCVDMSASLLPKYVMSYLLLFSIHQSFPSLKYHYSSALLSHITVHSSIWNRLRNYCITWSLRLMQRRERYRELAACMHSNRSQCNGWRRLHCQSVTRVLLSHTDCVDWDASDNTERQTWRGIYLMIEVADRHLFTTSSPSSKRVHRDSSLLEQHRINSVPR